MREAKIALTGGIATGKSTVANMLRKLGAAVIDADEQARRVVEPGTESWEKLRSLLGPEYFNPDGTLRRRELRERIIRDPDCRKKLEAVLHPFILRAMWREREKARALHPDSLVIFDIPLLFEGGFDKNFDIVILAYAPPQIQVERLVARDGLDPEEARRTLSIQYPIDSKKSNSTYVIDNSGDLDLTLEQVRRLWSDLTK